MFQKNHQNNCQKIIQVFVESIHKDMMIEFRNPTAHTDRQMGISDSRSSACSERGQ